jgi:hypothetical protein
LQPWRHHSHAALSETSGGGRRHTMPTGLRQSAYCVHGRCAQSDQQVPCPNQGEGFLLLDRTV